MSVREPRNPAVKPVDPSLKIVFWASESYLNAGTAPQRGTMGEGILVKTTVKSLDRNWPIVTTMEVDVGAPTWSSARMRGRPMLDRYIDDNPEKLAMDIRIAIPNPRATTVSSTPSTSTNTSTQTLRRERLSVRRKRAMLVLPLRSLSPA